MSDYISNINRFIKILFKVIVRFDIVELNNFFNWIKSLTPKHNSIIDRSPWINYKAKHFLKNYLKKNMSVFEYGSGGSTLFFSSKVKEIISVEHDKSWFNFVKAQITKMKLKNCNLILSEPKLTKQDSIYSNNNYSSMSPGFKNANFKDYVHQIDAYPNNYFDLVVVDGRSRASCIKNAIGKIKPGGYLMLDNSQRKIYSLLNSKLLSVYKKKVFRGLTPYQLDFEKTTFWKIK